MAGRRIFQLHHIAKFFNDNERQLRRGEIAYTDGHVKSMYFNGTLTPKVLQGSVQASQKKSVQYNVEISYSEDTGVIANQCSCAAGQDICHHQAALLFYGYNNVSSTDVECRWKAAPRKKGDEEVKTLEEMFPSRKTYTASTRALSAEEIGAFQQNLGHSNVVGFSWLLKGEIPEPVFELMPSIEDILFSSDYINAADKRDFFVSSCQITDERILMIEECTRGQHSNENWLVCRKMRLTASKFGLVLNAVKRNSYPPSLFKNLLEGYDLHRAMAVQWGKQHEVTALQKFRELIQVEVRGCGLFLDQCGFLGASPDGLINEDTCLEIKCPYRYRDGKLKEGVQKKKDYFFFYDENGDIVLREDHQYYHQLQGQLYLTGRTQCYFFVWTPEDCETLLIDKDPEWEKNLDILKQFYLDKFIPYVCGLHGYSSDES